MNNIKQKLVFITEGCYPVPAVKGGAVGELIESLIRENSKTSKYDISVFSCYNEKAEKSAVGARFFYIKLNKIVGYIDSFIYKIFSLYKKSGENKRFIFQRIIYLTKVSRILSKEKFDITIIEGNSTILLILKNNKRLKNNLGKIVFHVHNTVGRIYGCESVINNIDAIIGNSEYALNDFERKYISNSKIKKFILKNCVSKKTLLCKEKFDIRKIHSINDNSKIILYVGRLTKQKGIEELVKAFSKIEYSNLTLLIVGRVQFGLGTKSSFENELVQIASNSKNRVIFAGYINNSILANYYSQSDVCIFPSLYGEAAGMVIIEALCFGKLVVTTDVGGIPEYVDKTKVVFIDPKNAENSIQKVISQIDIESKKYNTNEIRKWAVINYSEKKYFKEFVRIIDQI